MQVHRRTFGLTMLALAATPAKAVRMTCGGGGWEDDPSYWPRGTALDPVLATVQDRRILRLNAGMPKQPSLDQLKAHHAAIYPQTIEQGFARMGPARMKAYFRAASDKELAHMAYLYRFDLNSQSRLGFLLPILAARAEDSALQRVARAFGTMPVYEALARYAPQRLLAFESAARGVVIAEPPLNQTGQFVPNVDMTITRIYQGFRSSPIGASSVLGSAYETIAFAAKPFGMATTAIGFTYYVVSPFLAEYTPTLWNAIGSGVNSMVNIVEGLGGFLTNPTVPQAQQSSTYDFQITPYASLLEQTGGDYGVVEEWSVAAGYGGGGC